MGIALGAAAPACFGQSHGEEGPGDGEPPGSGGDAGSSGAGVPGSGGTGSGPVAGGGGSSGSSPGGGGTDPGTSGGSAGRGGDPAAGGGPSIDPFCDFTWPPTKANPEPQPMPCVDPFNQCTSAELPYCYRTLGRGECEGGDGQLAPLYCVEGEWQCPPGSVGHADCACFVWEHGSSNCPGRTDAGADGQGAGGAGGETGDGS